MSVPPDHCHICMCTHFAAVALPGAADSSGVLRGSILDFNGDETGPASRRSWPKAARATLVRFACSEDISRSRLRHCETEWGLIL
ncbi:hypothetical protein FIBSPDRAFT_875032 [Athelia psychrophila]|uniref:Uncharacterized protein n=1 Tax=Athelia psychrophila TaxID=1759441 RepID=A0A165WRP5_9AGAM|nr:hypothetical protein FIBSPDRAFT_875032 [Fibularhizoctonia sp. CBS 109695]